MSFVQFKEVTTANPGSATRYGSDDLLDIMKIFNGKITSNKRIEILNPFRMLGVIELKQVTTPGTPTEANVIYLYNDSADNKVKVKKSGGTIVNLEDIGSGAWSNSSIETITNKTMNIDQNTFKHSSSNFAGDIYKSDGTKMIRMGKGTANQVLATNAAATDIEWQTVAGGGGGGEANTGSNVGTAGIGLFLQKLGVDLQFKKIFSPSGQILITDNVANDRIDLDLGSSVVNTNEANTYGDFQQTFRNARLVVMNPANTFGYFFIGSALTASRNITLPLLTSDDTIVVLALAQTLTNKTLGSGVTADVNTITLKHSTTNNIGDILKNTGSKFDRFSRGAANTYLRTNAGGTDIEWGTLPPSTPTPREDCAATFGPAGLDNFPSAFTDVINSYTTFAGSSLDVGTKAVSPIDFTAKTQYRVSVAIVISAGTCGVRIVDDANTSNVLHTFSGAGNSTQISSLTSLPVWATGQKTLRLQVGNGDGTDEVGITNAMVFLK
jgi:hypothetical protein